MRPSVHRLGFRLTLSAFFACVVAREAWPQPPPYRWTFSLRFQESGSSNPRIFTFPDLTESQIVDSLGASLTYVQVTDRSQVALSGRLAGNRFRDFRELDSIHYSGGLSWSYQASPHLRASVTQGIASGFDPQTLYSLGALPYDLDVFTYQALGGVSYQSSPRTSLTTSVSYNWTRFDSPWPVEGSQLVLDRPAFAEEPPGPLLDVPEQPEEEVAPPDAQDFLLDVLAAEGLREPELTYQAAAARIGVSHRLSPSTSASLDFHYEYQFFESRAYGDGPRYGASAGLSKRLSALDSVFTSYSIQRSRSHDPATITHNLHGGWSRTVRRQIPEMSLNASGGVSYFDATGATQDLSLIADVGLSSRLSRSAAVSARYSRQYYQSLGFGRNFLTDWASADVSQGITSRVEIRASAAYTLGRDPLEPGSRFTGERYAGYLTFRIARGFGAGATYQNWITTQHLEGALSRRRSDLWAFFLAYTKSWPRSR